MTMSNEHEERLKQAPERIWTVGGAGGHFYPTRRNFASVEYVRADLLDHQAAGCSQCGGPHDFDTSVPSVVWNAVIRARGLPDYLCATCILREFVRVKRGFTAELWNEEFNGVPIEVVVNGQNARDAALIQEENNALRHQLNDAAQSIVNEAGRRNSGAG